MLVVRSLLRFVVAGFAVLGFAGCGASGSGQITEDLWTVVDYSGSGAPTIEGGYAELSFVESDDGTEPLMFIDGCANLAWGQRVSDDGTFETFPKLDDPCFGELLDVLRRADSWSVADDTLTLRTPSGDTITATR